MNESEIAENIAENRAEDGVEDGLVLSPEDKKRRRRRSVAIALGLIFLVALFYLMTIYKFGPELMNKPL
tara:strand:- start:14262 stop:14468 length:207 start_codon:yes stop_codon:yes gene_type:complete